MRNTHTWQNIDKDGTIGWHRCSACGIRRHFPNNETKDYLEFLSCSERQTAVAKTVANKITNLLHSHDADTKPVRELLANLIAKHEIDSPYTRVAQTEV